MKTIVKIVVKTVRNVRVSILAVCFLAVCFLAFLCFIGKLEANDVVVAQENNVVAQNQEEQKEIPSAPWLTLTQQTTSQVVPEPQPKPLTQEQLEAIAIQPATMNKETGSRVVPAMLPLFKEESITYTGKEKYKNNVLKYRLHVPENIEKGKKYPLILWLHGAGEVGDDNKLQLIHLHHIITYLTGEKKRDFFLLVPQAPQQHGSWGTHSYTNNLPESLAKLLKDPQTNEKILKQYESAFGSETKATVSITEIDNQTMLTVSEPLEDSPLGFSFAMLDQVIENYPVDTDRITVSGLSTGGDGTWRALEYRPELFAAAVPLVSWRALTDVELQKSPVLKKIPIWAIYSSDDNGIDQARSDFERVEKAGCNVKKSEFGICGHNAWTPAMLQADIFSWLLSRAKKDGEYIAVTDSNVNPDDLKGIVEVATRDPGKPKLAPAPPQTVQQTVTETTEKTVTETATETANTELKPAASFSVPQPTQSIPQPKILIQEEEEETISPPQPPQNLPSAQNPPLKQNIITVKRTDSAGNVITETRTFVTQSVSTNDKDELYTKLALYYFESGNFEGFSRTFVKLTPVAQKLLAEKVLDSKVLDRPDVAASAWLPILEKLIDQIPVNNPIPDQTLISAQTLTARTSVHSIPATAIPTPQNVPPKITPNKVDAKPIYTPQSESPQSEPPKFTAQHGDNEVTVTGKVIEDCDRPWAMTSDSLYGMFPADWNKEAQKIPQFIVESDSSQLAKKLAASVSGNGKDFIAACQSILALENKPMSSPWFETGGGRLRSDIRYSLSSKGQMFVRLLKTVKDSTGNEEKNNRAKLAQKTLEKIELILE
ncbi:MAG: hypothetical protein LBE12_05215 [Planctomycetaceae bacterium]|nr:hypothetical protein [Planctomycetaceae bacterium]